MFRDLPAKSMNDAAPLLIHRPTNARVKLAAVFRNTPKASRERLMSYVCFMGYPFKPLAK